MLLKFDQQASLAQAVAASHSGEQHAGPRGAGLPGRLVVDVIHMSKVRRCQASQTNSPRQAHLHLELKGSTLFQPLTPPAKKRMWLP